MELPLAQTQYLGLVTQGERLPDVPSYSGVIFDWDGTLVDSREVCFDGLSRAMADAGIWLDPLWYWPRQAIASPDMLIVWEQEFGMLPEPIADIIDRCRGYVQAAAGNLTIIEDNAQIARAAKARGQKLAIGSNASTNTVEAGLTATGLGALFDVVVTWSDVMPGRGKPEPDIFLLAADKIDVHPSSCLVFEDAEIGVTAALAAGMDVLNVQTGVFNRTSR